MPARPLIAIAIRAALCITATVPTLGAQSFAHNKLEFMNWWIEDREDLFPNFLAASGNLDGDGLFKVFPAELLERDGVHRVSGYKIGISVDDAYKGTFPQLLAIPGMQLFRTKVAAFGSQSYETIDHNVKVGPQFDPIPVLIPSDGSWVLDLGFDPNSADPKLSQLLSIPAQVGGKRAGLAMLVLAPIGEKSSASTPGIVMQASYLERHWVPGRRSYSGSYEISTDTTRMYGTSGMPSASGELYVGLRFQNPTLQVYGSQAGGFVGDPYETYLGPGAYATDLGSTTKPGFFGIFVQAEQFKPSGTNATHQAFPFVVAQSLAGPTATLDVFGAKMRYAPAEIQGAEILVSAGFFGDIKRYTAQGSAGWDQDQQGVWNSGRIPLPPSPGLVGVDLWLQALITTKSMQPVDTTNAVRMTLR